MMKIHAIWSVDARFAQLSNISPGPAVKLNGTDTRRRLPVTMASKPGMRDRTDA